MNNDGKDKEYFRNEKIRQNKIRLELKEKMSTLFFSAAQIPIGKRKEKNY